MWSPLSATVFAAALVAPALGAPDAWHMDNIQVLSTQQLDPVLFPNAQAAHMHKIFGGYRPGLTALTRRQ